MELDRLGKRTYQTRSPSPRTRHANAQNRVGAQVLLPLRAIQLTHKRINLLELRLDVEMLGDERGCDFRGHVQHGLRDPFAAIGCGGGVAELESFVDSC